MEDAIVVCTVVALAVAPHAAEGGGTSMNRIKEALLGKTIVSHVLADDGSCITLACSDGSSVRLVAYGQCCSTAWIESIDDEAALHGRVLDVEEIAMPNLGNIDGTRHKGVDEVSYYGLKITTEKGRSVLDYRNDSNGAYDGRLEVQP